LVKIKGSTESTESQLSEDREERRENLLGWEELAAGVAHELKNPLAAMRGFLQLLAERLGGDEVNSYYVEVVLHELARLEHLVEDFLCLGRSTSVRLEPRDLSEIIREVVAMAGVQAKRQGVDIACTIEKCPLVWADGYLIKQVLWNLISNALAAMPAGGKLTLSLAPGRPGWVKITCRDTGEGIPPAVLPHIFEPYFTTKEEGTGLGLTISRRIVELHGGRLEVDTAPGRGTTVSVWLPVRRAN
jgi:signal transduction histidine kinase